ncbi:cellulose synthase-like B3 [Actinidia rufa]|uniref:Cellulose synthase-like B3 n=1 Tax=Actinidia rufa TaxID=165716 RepID=A0A7J0GIX0_9ERIC|nr:cellulose synthase-like B3 [Actinidia rufa]
MNTVLSVVALDYPPEKLAVYLSDDGGSPVSLYAIKEACLFARSWVPFCRKYGIKTRCPEAYFSSFCDDERLLLLSDNSRAEEENIRSMYELFKKNVETAKCVGIEGSVMQDRPPLIEVIHDNRENGLNNNDETKIPLVVYMSRKKRSNYPHHFKAGALNTLLRVSGIIRNGPYVLVLDCDMYCNDPTSARQAMCFHLDPHMSRSLAFVQNPQIFYNVSKNDIYDSQSRSAYKRMWQGMDGLRGPTLTGTGYYLKGEALYGSPNQEDAFLHEAERSFGLSSKFITSLNGTSNQDTNGKEYHQMQFWKSLKTWPVAPMKTTQNGAKRQIGYSYDCLLESTFTGYLLHCKGWKSVYLYPKRLCFLGCATTNMKEAMVQRMKWSSGLFQFGFSRFSPLAYGMPKMSILQSMCYGFFTFSTLLSVAFLIYGIGPQLCLLSSIPLYPKVRFLTHGSWPLRLYMHPPPVSIYTTSSPLGRIIQDVVERAKNVGDEVDHRITIRMPRRVDNLLRHCKSKFQVDKQGHRSRKARRVQERQIQLPRGRNVHDPLVNISRAKHGICLVGGVIRTMRERMFGEMFGQVFICYWGLLLSYPILEGIIRKQR